jgi:O-antigen/teichoic acid export membrane protein
MEQVSAVGVLVQVGLLCCAREFLVIVLGRGGDKWIPATVALQILCLHGIVWLLLEPIGNVLVALGRTSLLFRANLIATICEVTLVYPALILGGINGMAIVVTFSYAIQWIVHWPQIRASLNIKIAHMGRILLPSAVAGACAYSTTLVIDAYVPSGVASLMIKILAVTIVFGTVQGRLSSWRWFEEWRQLYLLA